MRVERAAVQELHVVWQLGGNRSRLVLDLDKGWNVDATNDVQRPEGRGTIRQST
jgi:hypothetical protein